MKPAVIRSKLWLGARQMLQAALEAEVTKYLQRPYYERGEAVRGYRNGYLPERGLILGSGGQSSTSEW